MDNFKKGFGTVLGVFAGLWTVDFIGKIIKQSVNKIEKEKEETEEKSKADLWAESIK